MPVLQVTRKWSGIDSNVAASPERNGPQQRDDTLVFSILVDQPGYHADYVRVQAYSVGPDPLPMIGHLHPSSPYAFCRHINIRQVAPIIFEAVCQYEAIGADLDPHDPEQKPPWQQPPKIRWSTVSGEEEIDEDVDGNPIVTECKEPFRSVRMKIDDPYVTITRPVPTFSASEIFDYINHVNSDTFLGAPPGTARVDKYEANSVEWNGVNYWERTVGVHFRRGIRSTDARAWWKRLRHEGLYHKYHTGDLDNDEIKIARALDDRGGEVSKPVLLDANGFRLIEGEPAVWKEFQIYPTAPLSPLVQP